MMANMSLAEPAPRATAQTDDVLMRLRAQLGRARGEIEERFVAGGEALRLAHEIVTELLHATESMVVALGDEDARQATETLAAAMDELRRRSDHSQDRADLETISKAGAAIPPLLTEMRGVLGYIGTCAIATRITGAGSDDFRGFADDIARYAGEASAEVARYAVRIAEINTRIGTASIESARAIDQARHDAPSVVETLMATTRAIARHRHDLANAAERTADLARHVGTRVATVLSALQIGDVTRQRIEHVEKALDLLPLTTAGDGESDALIAAAMRLFAAQVAALHDDFTAQTHQIVETIHGLARDAQAILALKTATAGARHPGEDDPMRVLQHGIEAAIAIATSIDDAHDRAEAANDHANRLARELLDNTSSIGNLRNVRDDIRCLAINAYLKSSRLGTAGRAVGVIATEMSLSGERLGTVAETVLARLGDLGARRLNRRQATSSHDIAGDLRRVVAALRHAGDAAERSFAIVSAKGDTVVDRIAGIARALDFNSSLGDNLKDCLTLLRGAPVDTASNPESAEIKSFSRSVFSFYTMASEREVHLLVLGDADLASRTPPAAEITPTATEDVDDWLL